MRIGVMLRNMGEKGGIVVYATNLLNSLFELDQENEYVLLYRHPEDLGTFPTRPNVTEVVVPAPNKLWWDQISVPLLARKEELDVLFNPKLSIPLLAPCETVWVMHGAEQFAVPEVFPWIDRAYFSIANRLYPKAASAIITMTEKGVGDIARFMGADPKKMFAIHESYNEACHVMSESETRGVRETYDLPDRFMLFVGGLTPLKNIGNLLRAFNRIRDDVDHDLVVVGFKRWKYASDLELIESLGLKDRVKFTGFVPDEDLPAIYNLADLFVFPSLYEGFGIPVLEAMACACPVVATKTGCSPEVAGDAALFVDPYDPDDIAGAMLRLLTDEALREKMIARGLERVKDFSWEKTARKTLDVFESLQPSSNYKRNGHQSLPLPT